MNSKVTRPAPYAGCLIFSANRQKDLGMLVRLEYVLKTDDRFLSFSKHLSPVDRGQGALCWKTSAASCVSASRITSWVRMGPAAIAFRARWMTVQAAWNRKLFRSIPVSGHALPIGSTLGKAFEHLLGQALEYRFPDHPEFDGEIKLVDLAKYLRWCVGRSLPTTIGSMSTARYAP